MNYNRNTDRDNLIKAALDRLPTWIHSDFRYAWPEWKIIRDCFDGERAIKEARTEYLPELGCMDPSDYNEYLNLATFHNMVGITVQSLHGTIFRRSFKISDWPKKLEEDLSNISRKQGSLQNTLKEAAQELLQLGRYGILLDMADSGDSKPYFAGYIAENILDWETKTVKGREVVVKVILRELDLTPRKEGEKRKYATTYRVLSLDPIDGNDDYEGELVYSQRVYRKFGAEGVPEDATLREEDLEEVHFPTIRGNMFDYIPFVFLGSFTNGPGVNNPPMKDIARLNIAHYQNYASYESGLFYTGLPIYWATKNGNGDREYKIGPNMVWELGIGEKAGILEFNGQGLIFLERSLQAKEHQISILGARLMGTQGQATSESDNQLNMKNRNEQALLLNVTQAMDEAFTQLLRWYARWTDVPEAQISKIELQLNKDFLLENIGARELRAIHSMYTDGLLPIEVLYDYLRKAEVIPDFMELDEFRKLLDNMDSFPNQPDVEAKAGGFPDAKTKLEQENKEKEREDLLQNNRNQDTLSPGEDVIAARMKDLS